MTRQTQRFWISILVILAATSLTAVVLVLDLTVPPEVGAAIASLWTLVAIIVRDNRNRSDIDKEELEAEVSREQRVKAAEREMKGNLMGEDQVKALIASHIRDLK